MCQTLAQIRAALYGCLTTLLVAIPALANDTAVVGAGGRWQRLGEGITRVQMVREAVYLNLDQKSSYLTSAEFVFKNQGGPTQITMGFPESGYGDVPGQDYRAKSGFSQFRSWVDGAPVTIKRSPAQVTEMQYSAFWTKQVTFGKGQIRRVRVSYRSAYGTIADPLRRLCTYQFTGGNWWGKVDSSSLTVQFSRPGTYLTRPKSGQTSPVFRKEGNTLIYSWKNWQAEQNFTLMFARTAPQWLMWPTANNLLSDTIQINVAGNGSEVEWDLMPAAFIRQGKTYVALRPSWQSQDDTVWNPDVAWTPSYLQVKQGQKVARFSEGSGEILVLGPASARTSYVRLSSLLEKLGVGLSVDLAKNTIKLEPNAVLQ